MGSLTPVKLAFLQNRFSSNTDGSVNKLTTNVYAPEKSTNFIIDFMSTFSRPHYQL